MCRVYSSPVTPTPTVAGDGWSVCVCNVCMYVIPVGFTPHIFRVKHTYAKGTSCGSTARTESHRRLLIEHELGPHGTASRTDTRTQSRGLWGGLRFRVPAWLSFTLSSLPQRNPTQGKGWSGSGGGRWFERGAAPCVYEDDECVAGEVVPPTSPPPTFAAHSPLRCAPPPLDRRVCGPQRRV